MHGLIVGDSHTGPLARGHALLVEEGRLPPGIDWRFRALGSGRRMNAAFWKPRGAHAVMTDATYRQRVGKLPPDNPRPDVIGLSMPLWSGRVLRSLLEARMAPWDVDTGPTFAARRISHALFHRLIDADMEYTLGLALFLRGTGVPVFIVEPPRAFRAYRLVAEVGATPVLALQQAIRTYQARVIATAGLPVVWMPGDALDEAGFMRTEHAHEDPTDSHHINAAFGARQLLAGVPLMRALAAGEAAPVAANG